MSSIWREHKARQDAAHAALNDAFTKIVDGQTPKTLTSEFAPSSVRAFITHGQSTNWSAQAKLAMQAISTLMKEDKDTATALLSGNGAVFQLARNGQAKDVLTHIKALSNEQKAKVLASDEAIYGLIQYAKDGEQHAIDLYDALPENLQKQVEYNVESTRPDAMRNHYLLQGARSTLEQTSPQYAIAI